MWTCCHGVFAANITNKCEGPFAQKTSRRKLLPTKERDMPCWPVPGLSMLHHNKMRLRDMLSVFVGHGARLWNLGVATLRELYLVSSEVWEFWLAEFWRRAGSGLQPTNRIHSFGPSACHRHHYVAKACPRAGAYRHNHQARATFSNLRLGTRCKWSL